MGLSDVVFNSYGTNNFGVSHRYIFTTATTIRMNKLLFLKIYLKQYLYIIFACA